MTRRTGDIRKTTAFLRGENGAITVESVLWLPFYLMFIALIADVSMVFHQHSKAQRIAQDINRLAVLTWLETEAEMQSRAEKIVKSIAPNATVTISFKADRVQTFITMPSADIMPVGILTALGSFDVSASAAHIREL